MSDSFYVTFNSDVADPVYDQTNKIADFLTKLSPSITLENEGWKVALVSFHLTNSFDSIRHDNEYSIQIRRPAAAINSSEANARSLVVNIRLPMNKKYNSVEEIVKDINNLVYTPGGIKFGYSSKFKKVFIIGLNPNETVVLSEGLREVLGFEKNTVSVDMTRDINPQRDFGVEGALVAGLQFAWNSIYVYTNLVERSRVGNTTAPILRVLPRQTTNDDVMSYSIQPLIYHDINNKNIEIVHFSFRTEKGKIIPINRGIISLTVHFKKDA